MQESKYMALDVSIARFSPMRRLLSGEDEEFLIRHGFRREASRVRAHHRQFFFGFVDMLESDFNLVHAARKRAMADNWDFETLMKERLTASYYLMALRAAGFMHFMNLPQAASVAEAFFERVCPLISIPVLASARVGA
jgi:hypothetical protein